MKHKKTFFNIKDAFFAFDINFLNEDICRKWMIEQLHPKGAYCPKCGIQIIDSKKLYRFKQVLRLKCSECGEFFTSLKGTFLEKIRLNFRQLMLLAVYLYLGLDNRTIATILNRRLGTVRRWRVKFEALGE